MPKKTRLTNLAVNVEADEAKVAAGQIQEGKAHARISMRAAVGAGQGEQVVDGSSEVVIDMRIKCGVVEEIKPNYSGDPLPEIFLAA